jgi:hypothetical protein
LRSFLRFTGYYRRFIPRHAHICKPLYSALKKKAFQWGPEQHVAFATLKTVMSHPPLLALPNFFLPFTLETDAFASGLGGILGAKFQALSLF